MIKAILTPVIAFSFLVSCNAALADNKQGVFEKEEMFDRARRTMMETQIKARGIKDERLLEAMFKVKRHKFVPLKFRNLAYKDHPLPIGEGQTISQPYIVALMTELLELEGDERVLEIGTGSGYQAAILAELAKEVYTIEILEPLARKSEKLLKGLGYKNITVKCGDGYLGWPKQAPFDAIIVTCAPDEVPKALLEQLAEGGRMVIPVGTHWQELKLLRKLKGRIKTKNIIPVKFVPMIRDHQGGDMENSAFIVPIGKIDKALLKELATVLDERFMISFDIKDSIEIPPEAFNSKRNQYSSSKILEKLSKIKAKLVLGVIDKDLYVPELNFVFGQAESPGRCALISITRLRQEYYGLPKDDKLFLERVAKEAVHELGHTQELQHCSNPECVMFFSNSLMDTDRKSSSFCKRCRKELGL